MLSLVTALISAVGGAFGQLFRWLRSGRSVQIVAIEALSHQIDRNAAQIERLEKRVDMIEAKVDVERSLKHAAAKDANELLLAMHAARPVCNCGVIPRYLAERTAREKAEKAQPPVPVAAPAT